MIYVFIASGFEEAEALIPVDILRRNGISVQTVGVGGKIVTGSHGIPVVCDVEISDVSTSDLEGIILPGGMPGTLNLENNSTVQQMIDYSVMNSLYIGAICAAPSILGHKGILKDKNATCFPGFEKDLYGATYQDAPAVIDGKIVTGQGAGAAFAFGFSFLSALCGQEAADSLSNGMKYPK